MAVFWRMDGFDEGIAKIGQPICYVWFWILGQVFLKTRAMRLFRKLD